MRTRRRPKRPRSPPPRRAKAWTPSTPTPQTMLSLPRASVDEPTRGGRRGAAGECEMKKYLEKSGKTEDEALAAALAELGLERDDVSVEIVERAKSGFLGIGASPAVIRVEYEVPDEPEVEEPPAEAEAAPPKRPQTPQGERRRGEKPLRPSPSTPRASRPPPRASCAACLSAWASRPR